MFLATSFAAVMTAVSPSLAQDAGSQPNQNRSVSVFDARDLSEILQGQINRTMESLCGIVGAECAPIANAIFAVGATPQQAESISAALDAMRELHENRYDAELIMVELGDAELPDVGASLTLPDDVSARIRHSIREGTRISFDASTAMSYVSDLQPVVSSAIGYDPEISQVTSGLQTEVLINSTAEGVELSIRGSVSKVSFTDVDMALLGGDTLPLQVPAVESRSVAASQELSFDKLTVVNVMSGFRPGVSIVIAMRVNELP